MTGIFPHPDGRPSSYRPEYCEEVVDLGKKGKSRIQMAAKIGVARQTLDRWAKEFPEFGEAFDMARMYAQAWWEDQGQVGIWSKEFNANAYSLQIRNRFPDEWKDKQDHKVEGGVTINITQTDEQL